MTTTVVAIGALWLGSLFVYSASLKFLEPAAHTVNDVRGYRILPVGVSRVVGLTLPYAELAIGTLILLTPFARVGFATAAAFGAAFGASAASVIVRRINTSCGCAGKASTPVGLTTLARAALVTTAAIASYANGAEVPAPYGVLAFLVSISPASLMILRFRRDPSRRTPHIHHAAHPRSLAGTSSPEVRVGSTSKAT